MKKLYFLVALLVGFASFSCQKEIQYAIDPASLTFTAAAGEQTIVVSNVSGTLDVSSSAEDWCTVSTNANRVIVAVTANESEQQRTATVTIDYRGSVKEVPVTQEALSVDFSGILSKAEVGLEGGTVSLGTIVSAIEPIISAPVDWITNPQVAEDGNVTVDVAANDEGEDRTAIITIKVTDGNTASVELLQTYDAGVKIEYTEGQLMGEYKVINFTVTATGAADDFAFVPLNASVAAYSDEEIMDEIEKTLSYGQAYTSADFAAGPIGFMLPMGETTFACAMPMIDGDLVRTLERVEISLDPFSPTEMYKHWLGTYEISVPTAANQTVNSTFSILEANGAAYSTVGWNYLGENIPIPAAFDDKTNDLYFYGQIIGYLEDNSPVYLFPVSDITTGMFYTAINVEIARAKYSETGSATLQGSQLETGDQGVITVQSMLLLVEQSDGWAFLAGEQVAEMSQLWKFPATLTKTGTASAAIATEGLKPYFTHNNVITPVEFFSIVPQVVSVKAE